MADYKLQIKDGSGNSQELYTDSGSNGLVPYHAISGSISAAISNFPATQSVSLVNTGSLTASLSPADMTTLTASISAVSSAVAHSLDKFIAGILENGSSSFNVDIVAGDVNTITGSVDKVTAEVAKLTALSNSSGLLIRGDVTASVTFPATQSVSLVNTSSLTASVANWPSSYSVTSSYQHPAVVVHSGAISTSPALTTFATAVHSITGSAAESQTTWGQEIGKLTTPIDADIKSVIISNQLNSYLYLGLFNGAGNVTTSSYVYSIDPYSTYECLPANLKLWHRVIAHPSASSGIATMTVTF